MRLSSRMQCMTYKQIGTRLGQKSPPTKAPGVAFLVGGVLIVWSSYIHFHLWHDLGYRQIPTIGWLFLTQSIVGLLIGLTILIVRRVWAGVLGIGFSLATMVGFLISVNHGLFGFKDSGSAPFAHQALAIEIATIAVLGVALVLCLIGPGPLRARIDSGPLPSAGADRSGQNRL
jgi:hypothetical protein